MGDNMYQILNYYFRKNRRKLSLIDTNEKNMYLWVNELLKIPFGQACEQLFVMLTEVLQLRHSIFIRFQLIEVLNQRAVIILEHLESSIHQQEYLKNDERYEQMLTLFSCLRALFIKNYIRLAEESFDILKKEKIPFWQITKLNRMRTIFLQSTYNALKHLSVLTYQQHSLDMPYLLKQWYETHLLYVRANHLNFEKSNIIITLERENHKEEQDITFTTPTERIQTIMTSVEKVYAEIIIFSIIGHRQLNTLDIAQLHKFSQEWSEYIDIHRNPAVLSKYKINIQDDLKPIENKTENQKIYADYFVDLTRLAQLFSLRYYHSNKISSVLNFRIQQVLLQSHERRHQRYQYSSILDIYVGFNGAFFFLEHDDFSEKVARHEMVRYQADVEDKSAQGYKAYWSGEVVPQELKQGVFLLIKEQSEEESKRGWQSAIVRRVGKTVNNKVELGIEVLACEQITCQVRFHSLTSYALLLHRYHSDGERWSLILPAHHNIPAGQKVELLVKQKKMQIYVSKALLTTQNFVQSDIKLHDQREIDIFRAFF